MDDLIRKRGVLKSQLTRIESNIRTAEGKPDLLEQITERVERLNNIFSQFESIQFQCELHEECPDDGSQEVERQFFEDKYFSAKALASRILKNITGESSIMPEESSSQSNRSDGNSNGELSTAIKTLMDHQTSLAELVSRLPTDANTAVNSQERVGRSELRLQPITVPTFNGTYKEWPEFYDLFNSLVHNNQRFSPCEKLQYLKKALIGNASNILKNLTITDANYAQAYEELVNTFNKKDVIIDAYMQKIMEQQKLHSATADGLRTLCSNINESVRALHALDLPTQHWDRWLIYILSSKMDQESMKLWRRECSKRNEQEELKFTTLVTFINNRIYELSPLKDNNFNNQNNFQHKNYQLNKTKFIHTSSLSTYKCHYCQAEHAIYSCPKFLTLKVSKRRDFVKQKGLCFNCLRSKHLVKDCNSKFSCKHCNGKHNSLLHETKENNKVENVDYKNASSAQPAVLTAQLNDEKYSTILPTAIILIENIYGEYIQCRILLDSGSQVNLISESFVQQLKLKRKYARLLLTGVGTLNTGHTKGKVTLNIKSRINNFKLLSEALIINKVTSNLPTLTISKCSNEIFKNLELADPVYYKSEKIDMILGCNDFFKILQPGKIYNEDDKMAQQTQFGWVICGKGLIEKSNELLSLHTCIDIDERLKSFWEIEDFAITSSATEEEIETEEHFINNISRNNEGRYIVRLPFKKNSNALGISRNAALQTLLSMERRFEKDKNLKMQYSNFIKEYLDLGHMVEVSDGKKRLPHDQCYYLPHHAVFKQSTTTKLRVVFDASRKTSTGLSLNNLLLVGPTIQKDIWSLLLNFRKYKIAYTADIAKMYRQILVDERDIQYQRILWRNSANEQVKEYELLTVTYGTASAPFLAMRPLKQLAIDEGYNYEIGSKNLLENFYVDDFVGGSHTLQEGIIVKTELMNLLYLSGFDLRKWSSNSKEFLDTIKIDHREVATSLPLQEDNAIKALGLKWLPTSDCFSFDLNMDKIEQFTKRTILSEISKIYDPLGFLAPCTVLAKMLMQQIWVSGAGWDDVLSNDLIQQYTKLRTSLQFISKLKIPRWLNILANSTIQLCGFCDSSELAYAAAIYVRTVNDKNVSIHLLVAKTKVAPIQQISIPRLELCSAHLLAKLMKKVKLTMNYNEIDIVAFTDSTVVLAWLKAIPRKWKSFIANRTSQILSVLPFSKWRHVKSAENAADPASRGLLANNLIDMDLWWHGPKFLYNADFDKLSIVEDVNTELEIRTTCLHTTIYTNNTCSINIFEKYSCWRKLVYVIARCYRFINNCKNSIKKESELNKNNTLNYLEIQTTIKKLFKIAQNEEFTEEISSLKKGLTLPKGNKLISLDPFLDDDGLLRVGGRIRNANVAYDKKHPIILSKTHKITMLIVEDVHKKYFHANSQLMVNILHLRYWIIGCKYIVKKCIRNCIICRRYKAEGLSQQMGNLPAYRLEPSRPFTNTGTDYAGPFQIGSWKGRGAKQLKCYVAIFICMVTKAVHLELVTELTADKFIEALHRFTSRRGICNNIYSDNGRNFIGAARKISEFQRFLQLNEEVITNELSKNEITWHFIPAYTPNFGGLWESAVKSMKYHLKRSLGETIITFEEMCTLLCQIEACLNSRPIAPTTIAADDLEPLSPGHFLTQGPILLPQQEHLDEKLSYTNRWSRVQQINLSFWKRWSMEYISTLQKRKKWFEKTKNLQVDDIVLIKEENLPPCRWLLGRVVAIKPGKDNLVRVVTIKTKTGLINRNIRNLIALLDSN